MRTETALITLLLAQVREYSDNEFAIEYDENGQQARSVELASIDNWLATGDYHDLHHYNLHGDGEDDDPSTLDEIQAWDEAIAREDRES